MHQKPHRSFDICYRKSAPGGDPGRVALGAGANNSTPPRAASLGTFLAGQESTAAGRHRKYRCAVRLHAERLSVYNWLSAGLLAGFLRRVSFLFRQERHERTDIGEALCVLLPQSKPPSPMYPTRPHRKGMLIRFQIFKQALRIDCRICVISFFRLPGQGLFRQSVFSCILVFGFV